MRCPNCARDFTPATVMPINCRCGTRFDETGVLFVRQKQSDPMPDKPPRNPFYGKPGSALEASIPDWAVKTNAGCGCKNYAAQMDQWGVDGCRERESEIIDHLISQKEHLIAVLRWLPSPLQRQKAKQLVRNAIATAERPNAC